VVVLDASAVVELLLGGERAVALRERLGGESAHAPYLLEVEALSALRRHASHLSEAEAALARRSLGDMPLVLYPHRPLSERIWALRHVLTAYDACYVALAEALPAPLLTCDAPLAGTQGHDAAIELFRAAET
jgi:predicted nucleic acid-binding protein